MYGVSVCLMFKNKCMGNIGFLKHICTAIDSAKLCLEYTNKKKKNKLCRTASEVPVCWLIVVGH